MNKNIIFSKKNKKAILVANYGTSSQETRKKNIDIFLDEVKENFKDFEIRECYTSRIILKKLKEKNIFIDSPIEAMENLKKDGFSHIIIISTHIINGVEYENFIKDIEKFKNDFLEIKITPPLLNTTDNYINVAKILYDHFGFFDKDKALLFVGHGTLDSADSAYPCMDYIFKYLGYNYYIGTIKGFPSLNEIKMILKKEKIKKITLVPFMFVAGEHTKTDISIKWKKSLENFDFDVDIDFTSLGAIKGIRDIFISSGKFLSTQKNY